MNIHVTNKGFGMIGRPNFDGVGMEMHQDIRNVVLEHFEKLTKDSRLNTLKTHFLVTRVTTTAKNTKEASLKI